MPSKKERHKHIVMIRKNTDFGNLIRNKFSARIIIETAMQVNPGLEECPFCHCRGNLKPHASYMRYIIDIHEGKRLEDRISIPRLICSSCRHTHAILPDPIIPYKQYTLFFILKVLALHFIHLATVERICEDYGISISTFYCFLKVYSDHRADWEGLLEATTRSLKDSILDLLNRAPFSDLAYTFFRSTGISFLQSHKNPAFSHRNHDAMYPSPPPSHNTGMV